MEPTALADQSTCLCFCFRFDPRAVDYNRPDVPFTKSNGKQTQMWKPEKLHTYHLKRRCADMLSGDEADGTVGRLYTLDDSLRRDLGLPEARTQAFLRCRGRQDDLPLRLRQLRLALFYTGIGIVEFQLSCTGGWEDVLDMNYFLSEVKSDSNQILFRQKLGKDETQERSFRLVEKLEQLLAPLGEIEDFDTRAGLRFIDNKPLVFSYLLFDRFPEDMGRVLFSLRTNFKSSYKMPEQELSLEGNPAILHPFDNLYWGFSLNGAVCCAALTGDRSTDTFFRETFPHNLHITYQQLYLLRLHQRFMIQDLEDRFSAAGKALTGAKDEDVEAVYRAAEALKAEAAEFRLRCSFREPASVEHINRFDAALAGDMQLEKNYEGLKNSLLLLEQLSSSARDRLRRRAETVEKIRLVKRERIIYLATALWSMVLLFQSACQIMDRLLGRSLSVTEPLVAIPLIIAIAPAAKLLLDFRARGAELRRLQEQVRTESEPVEAAR